jgi:hypothetical protein
MLCNHRIMWKSVFVGVGLFSLTTFGHAYGTTYYTARTGSDSNSCAQATSPSTPKLTINAGLLCLSAGDTLYIRAGTYPEVLDSYLGTPWPSGTSWSNPVTIAGYPGETVTIKPAAAPNHAVLIFEDNGAYTDTSYREYYIILDNLIIDGSNQPHVGNVIKFDVGSRRIRLQNSKIIGSRLRGGMASAGHPGFNGVVMVMGQRRPFREKLKLSMLRLPETAYMGCTWVGQITV